VVYVQELLDLAAFVITTSLFSLRSSCAAFFLGRSEKLVMLEKAASERLFAG
jgi:hypothetical protein